MNAKYVVSMSHKLHIGKLLLQNVFIFVNWKLYVLPLWSNINLYYFFLSFSLPVKGGSHDSSLIWSSVMGVSLTKKNITKQSWIVLL